MIHVLYNCLVKLNGWLDMDSTETAQDSRSRIMEAAIDEFAEHGLAGARVDRIAHRAGANKEMIYYHFASKEKLYQSIFDRQISKLGAVMAPPIEPASDLEAVLLRISEFHHTFITDDRLRALFLHEVADGGSRLLAALMMVLSMHGLPQRLKDILDDGIRAGRYRPVDPRQALLSFIGMNMFYLFMAPIANSIWEITDEQTFCTERPRQIVDLFLRGLEVH